MALTHLVPGAVGTLMCQLKEISTAPLDAAVVSNKNIMCGVLSEGEMP